MLKRLGIPIILFMIEVIVYFIIKPNDPEIFFLAFIVFSGFILIYNIFNVTTNSSRIGGLGAGREGARMTLSTMQLEKQYETKASKKRLGGGLFDSSNISMAFFLLMNIGMYWWIMPK